MSGDFKKYTIKLPDGYYVVTTAVYGQGVPAASAYRFNIGTQVTYRGPSQSGHLGTGNLVEIVRLGSDPSYYIVKRANSIITDTWIVKDTDLEDTRKLPWSHTYTMFDDHVAYGDTPVDNSPNTSYDDLIEKRKANGECTACGKRLEMSFHGLLDCLCTPQLPARW